MRSVEWRVIKLFHKAELLGMLAIKGTKPLKHDSKLFFVRQLLIQMIKNVIMQLYSAIVIQLHNQCFFGWEIMVDCTDCHIRGFGNLTHRGTMKTMLSNECQGTFKNTFDIVWIYILNVHSAAKVPKYFEPCLSKYCYTAALFGRNFRKKNWGVNNC